MKTIRIVLSTVLAFVILYAAALAFGWVTAPWVGKVGARQQIQSATYRIDAYDHFYDLCAAIQSHEAAIDAQKARTDHSPHLQQNLAALQTRRATDINQYNADAAKSYTQGQFRASNLPYHLDPSPYDGTNKTHCTY